MNSARSKGGAPSGSKERKKPFKLIKKGSLLKHGEGKLRFKKVKDALTKKQKLIKKNPLKELRKISPDRKAKPVDKAKLHIPIDRVVPYSHYSKLSGRTKQSSDSGCSKVLIRKGSTFRRKNRENSNSRGNKTHLIFVDQQHSSKINDSTVVNNFNMSGPVNLNQKNCTIGFDSSILSQTKHQISITRGSNKSQQLVPDTNSTLAYTAA